jgi:hypothetical protein
MEYDVFICHASEDKASFVKPLAEALLAAHVVPWYDEFELRVGDSIRRVIDQGLSQSRFGIVVLSPAFFAKKWPQHELDGLLDRELSVGENVILPVWHGVNHDDVAAYSLPLAGRFSTSTNRGLTFVVEDLLKVVRPEKSPVVRAREILEAQGVDCPPASDSYWLFVAENVTAGLEWYRWTFPPPFDESTNENWGERLAWTFLALDWSRIADEMGISVTTRPEAVLDFIRGTPGLLNAFRSNLAIGTGFAPQLSIPGFGGELEQDYSKAFEDSRTHYHKMFGDLYRKDPRLSEVHSWLGLRHPTLDSMDPSQVARVYFRGETYGRRPASSGKGIDHLLWLLSNESNWLPTNIHESLLQGIVEWPSDWQWPDEDEELTWEEAGEVSDEITRAIETGRFDWTDAVLSDWHKRIAMAKASLNLLEPVEVLLEGIREVQLVEQTIKGGQAFDARRRQVPRDGRET